MKAPINDLKRHTALYVYWILFFLQIPITAILFRENTNNGTLFYAIVDVTFLFIYFVKHSKRLLGYYLLKLYPLMAYLVWCYLSSLWSISDATYYNIGLLLKDTIRLAIVALMLLSYEKHVFLLSFFRAVTVSAFLFGILVLLSADYVQELGANASRAMYEDYKGAVGIGRHVAFICLLLFAGYFLKYIKRSTLLISGAPCFLLAVLAFSKLSLAALFVSVYVAFMLHDKAGKLSIKRIFFGAFILLFISVAVIYTRYDYLMSYIEAYGGNVVATYSGRTLIWEALLPKVDAELIFGYGLNPVHELVQDYPFLKAGTAHNEILQQVLSYGWIGLVLWLFVYVKYYITYKRCADYKYSRVMLAVFVFNMISGLGESVLVLLIFPVYFLAMFWIIGLNENATSRRVVDQKKIQMLVIAGTGRCGSD